MDVKDEFVHGACLCGGVAFHAALPARGANHCYCTMCQKFHGAAAGSYLTVAASGYVVERGASLITEYASSNQGRRGFCRVCGASLYWRSTGQPDGIDLSLGTLDPAWTGIVERELYTEHKPSWLPPR
jgi:hypothetical protein